MAFDAEDCYVSYDPETGDMIIVMIGINADNERVVLDLSYFNGVIPNKWSLIVKRTAGSTAGIDVNLKGGNEGKAGTFVELCNVTAKDTYATFPAEATPETQVDYNLLEIDCDTVGSGNTLNAIVTGTRHY